MKFTQMNDRIQMSNVMFHRYMKYVYQLLMILLIGYFPLSAQEIQTKVTIQSQAISLKEVFYQIEKQTGYSIAYEQSEVNLGKVISLSLTHADVEYALKEILKGTGYTYKISGYHIVISQTKEHQESEESNNSPKKERRTLSGRVLEKHTNRPIEYTTISLLTDPSKGGITDSLGYFTIKNVPIGTLDIKVSTLGYKPIVVSNQSFDPTKTLTLSVVLDPNSYSLKEVVVTSSYSPDQLIRSSGMGFVPMDKTTIKNIPVIFGEADVIKALQTQPGVVGGIESLAGMYVRGGNGDENLYMLDGNPLYQINHFGGLFSTFNTEMIDHVDFYKSAFPARYGGRLSSVVNVQTKDGDMQTFHGTAMLGLTSGSLQVEGPIVKNKTSFNASVRRSWFEAISVPAFAIINSGKKRKETTMRYAFMDVNVKLKHIFNSRSHAYLNFYWGDDYLKFGKDINEDNDSGWFKGGDLSRLQWGNLLVSPHWVYSFSDVLSGNFSASYTHYASDLKRLVYERQEDKEEKTIENTSIENTHENGLEDYRVRADFNWAPASSHTVRFGADYTHHRYRPESSKTVSLKQEEEAIVGSGKEVLSADEIGVYIEDDWNANSFFSLNAGIRTSYYQIRKESFLSFEPRLSMRLLLSPIMSVKASYSRMRQYVQQVSESYMSLPTDYWIPVLKMQKPMLSDQLSAGLYYNLNNQYSFSLEGYYKWMNYLLDYKEGYNYLPSTTHWENKLTSGKGTGYGLDFIVRKETGRITGHIGYGLMWANRKFDEIDGGKTFPAKFDNRHKINILANYKISDKVELNVGWTYMTGNRMTVAIENYQDMHTAGIPPALAPTNPFFTTSYPGINYYERRNNVRLPAYHRLDVGINIFRPKKNGRMGIWNVSIYNVYSRMNPIAVTKDAMYSSYSGFSPAEIEWNNNFQTLGLLPIIPSVSYTYKF